MTFKQTLTDRRKIPSAIFHKFRVDSSIHSRPHIFVEGYEDIGFYSRHTPLGERGGAKFHLCFGKSGVDAVAKLYWRSNLDRAQVLFVRDSDFDQFLGTAPSGRNFFLTCGYAVENYVCTREAVHEFMKSVICLDEAEVDLNRVTTDYVDLVTMLHQWLSPLYGAAMKALKSGRKIDFNQLRIQDHFRKILNGDPPPEASSIAELGNIGLQSEDFNQESQELGRTYATLPALQWLRGKFLLSALTIFVREKEAAFRVLYKSGKITQFNVRAAANINESALFDRLSGLASPSERLNKYLRVIPNEQVNC